MAMDIIYKNQTKFDNDNNFSVDLSSNNYIQEMVFKGKDESLVSGLKLVIRKFEQTDEYKQLKKVFDLINKLKADQKSNITHGHIHTKLPDFTSFDHDNLICINLPTNKSYEYYNVETKKMNTTIFPDYKKWCKENKAVWNSRNYSFAQSKLEYFDEDHAHIIIKRRQDRSNYKANLTQILERMNKVYTLNGDRINESTDWVHFFMNRLIEVVIKIWEDIPLVIGKT